MVQEIQWYQRYSGAIKIAGREVGKASRLLGNPEYQFLLCKNPLILALLGASPGGSAPAAVASPVRIVPYYLSIKSERMIIGNIVES